MFVYLHHYYASYDTVQIIKTLLHTPTYIGMVWVMLLFILYLVFEVLYCAVRCCGRCTVPGI